MEDLDSSCFSRDSSFFVETFDSVSFSIEGDLLLDLFFCLFLDFFFPAEASCLSKDGDLLCCFFFFFLFLVFLVDGFDTSCFLKDGDGDLLKDGCLVLFDFLVTDLDLSTDGDLLPDGCSIILDLVSDNFDSSCFFIKGENLLGDMCLLLLDLVLDDFEPISMLKDGDLLCDVFLLLLDLVIGDLDLS